METAGTLLLNRQDVAGLLSIQECMQAVEHGFRQYAEGRVPPPKVSGISTGKGGFHIKSGIMNLGKNYFVSKINANFPNNQQNYQLPTIQGVIVVCDADNGKLLALMDSMEITMLRTGAATGVATKYLARQDAKNITIIGAGSQGIISLRAINQIREIETAYVFDIDSKKAKHLATSLAKELNITIKVIDEIIPSLLQSDICVTCTPSTTPFLKSGYIRPGTFIAAVGADYEYKQELYPELLSANKVVTDLTEQCANMGELHHAIEDRLMTRNHVYAELGEIIAGKKPGRQNNDEIIIFDSTGTALQDVVSAVIVYEKAVSMKDLRLFNFGKNSE